MISLLAQATLTALLGVLSLLVSALSTAVFAMAKTGATQNVVIEIAPIAWVGCLLLTLVFGVTALFEARGARDSRIRNRVALGFVAAALGLFPAAFVLLTGLTISSLG